MISINLLVLRSYNLILSLHFYECLGLTFVQEQHGNGPIHYSSNNNGIIIEIYPNTTNYHIEHLTRIGFSVEDIDELCSTLKNNDIDFTIYDCDTIITQDPDGRKIHLTKKDSYLNQH